MKPCFFFLLIALCSSCTTPLSVRSEYTSRNELASYIIGTPDHLKTADVFGQRLVIHWDIPKNRMQAGSAELLLDLKLRGGAEPLVRIPLTKSSGTLYYPISNKENSYRGELLSYLVTLTIEGKPYAVSRHKLWVETITIPE